MIRTLNSRPRPRHQVQHRQPSSERGRQAPYVCPAGPRRPDRVIQPARIDGRPHWRIVAGRATKGRLVFVESHKQDRRCPAAPPHLPCGLERPSRWLGGRSDHSGHCRYRVPLDRSQPDVEASMGGPSAPKEMVLYCPTVSPNEAPNRSLRMVTRNQRRRTISGHQRAIEIAFQECVARYGSLWDAHQSTSNFPHHIIRFRNDRAPTSLPAIVKVRIGAGNHSVRTRCQRDGR
jgi:hypothetical protein